MSNSKTVSFYDVVSKENGKLLEGGLTTRQVARNVKNEYGNAAILQRKYELVQKQVVR